MDFVDKPESLFHPCSGNNSSPIFCGMAKTMGILSLYVFPFVAIFGIWSNITIIYLFLRGLRDSTRQVVYLGALAIADILCIVSVGVLWFMPAKGVPYATGGTLGFFTYNQGVWACKIHRFLNLISSSLACNFFLLAVIDRCLSIYFVLSYGRKTRSLAVKLVLITLGVTLVMSVPYIPLIGYYQPVNSTLTFCWLTTPSTAWQIYISLFSNIALFQSIVIIFFNVALVIRLVAIRKERSNLHSNSSLDNGGLSKKEIGATLILIMLSAVYIICAIFNITGVAMAFVATYYTHDPMTLTLAYNIQDLSWHLFFMQEASNWFIYMFRMRKFRVAMCNIFRFRQPLFQYKESQTTLRAGRQMIQRL